MQINTQKKTKINIGNILLYGIAAFVLIYELLRSRFNLIWTDEAISIQLARASLKDTILQTAMDVHPPLHHIELKIFGRLFGFSGFVIHMAAWVIFAALILFTLTVIKKQFGFKTSLFFLVMSTMLPGALDTSISVRMYGMALFLCTLCFYFAYQALIEDKNIYWIGMTILGIAASYTHYFAFATACAIYGCMFLILLMHKKNMKKFFLCMLVSIASYVPWILFFIHAIHLVGVESWVSIEFWLQDVPSLKDCISFFFLEGLGGIILMILYVITMVLVLVRKRNGKDDMDYERTFVLWSVSVLLVIWIPAMGYSYLINPMLIMRHLFPLMGIMWLGFAIGFRRICKNSVIFYLVVAAVAALCIPQMISTYREDATCQRETDETVTFMDEHYDEDTLMISDYGQLPYLIFKYYLPDKNNTCWDWIENWDETKDVQKIYFFGEKELSEEYTGILKKNGFTDIHFLKKTHLGRYPIYFYEIFREKTTQK